MKLNEDWLTHGLIDFEYKKYLLLAYMKEIEQCFDEKRLYPFLSELVFHYNNLLRIKENKQLLSENFPKQLQKADLEKLKLSYQRIVKDDEMMQVLGEIVSFAIPKIKDTLNYGVDLYEEVARHIDIEPVGIAPLFNKEGYLFVCESHHKEIAIYRYQIASFQLSNEECFGIHTEFIGRQERNLVNTLEKIKVEIIKAHKAMPNPATFAAIARLHCPMESTLLPIAKRKLMQQIEQAA